MPKLLKKIFHCSKRVFFEIFLGKLSFTEIRNFFAKFAFLAHSYNITRELVNNLVCTVYVYNL